MGPKKTLNIAGQLYYTWLQAEPNSKLCSNHVDFMKAQDAVASLSDGKHQVVAYVLLPDSWHLVVRSGGSLNSGLDKIFTKYRNLVKGHSDLMPHHFSEPVLIEPGHYIHQVIKVLHWLPVFKGQVPDLDIYPWSSHHYFCGRDLHEWIHADDIINSMANHRAKRYRRYLQCVAAKPLVELKTLQTGNVDGYLALASDKYINSLTQTEPSEDADHTSVSGIELDDVVAFVCHEFNCSKEEIMNGSRQRFRANMIAIIGWLGENLSVGATKDIANALDVDPEVLKFSINGYSAQNPHQLAGLKSRFQLISNQPSLKKAFP